VQQEIDGQRAYTFVEQLVGLVERAESADTGRLVVVVGRVLSFVRLSYSCCHFEDSSLEGWKTPFSGKGTI
jgi:hypothetical protein